MLRYLLAGLILLCFRHKLWVESSDDELIHEPDNLLKQFILRASFDMNRDTTQSQYKVANSSDSQTAFLDAQINDVYIEAEGSEITLSSLKIFGAPNPRLTRSVPNMMYGYLDTNLEWSTVIVEGKYELYEKPVSHQMKPEEGTLRLIWINTKAEGRIAFRPIDDGDGFLSTVYDLDFTGDTFQIVIVDGEKSRRSSTILQAASKKFKSRLEKDVFWKLQYNLRDTVDRILRNRSMKQIFGNNLEMVKKYRAFIKNNENAANKFVDNILGKMQQRLIETGFWEVELSNYSREFSRHLDFMTVSGSLWFNNVTAQNISELRRKSSFSVIRSQTIELIGLLEFSNLQTFLKQFQVRLWNVENSGEVSSANMDSSMFIKFIVVEDEKSDVKYKPVGYELTVYIDNVRVEVRGLSFLFRWLQPLIELSAANYIKSNLVYTIEENIKQVLDSVIYVYLGLI